MAMALIGIGRSHPSRTFCVCVLVSASYRNFSGTFEMLTNPQYVGPGELLGAVASKILQIYSSSAQTNGNCLKPQDPRTRCVQKWYDYVPRTTVY